MATSDKIVEWQIRSGAPISVGDTVITPLAQALTVRWRHGGFVWNRPLALQVERKGQVERVPIYDRTRLIQVGLLAFGFVCLLVAYTTPVRAKEKQR